MQWTVRSRRQVYGSEWVEVWIDEVDANGRTFDHHVLRMPKRTVSTVPVSDDGVLLMWRHRFTTDTWGWEIPAGWVEPDEDLAAAALRETEEETGWRAGSIEPLVTYNFLNGICALAMHTFLATRLTFTGPPADDIESSRIEWIPLARIPELASRGEILDGTSLTGLTYYLTMRRQK